MDEVKDKMKGLMKKVNNPFSSSLSGKFKGQGRVLGSSSSSQSSSSSSSISNSKPSAQKVNIPEQRWENRKPETRVNSNASEVFENRSERKPETQANPNAPEKSEDGFDPFNPLITSGKRNPNGYSLKVFECPVCGKGYNSEEEVSIHVESCLTDGGSGLGSGNESVSKESDPIENQLQTCVSAYLSGKPSEASMEVVMRVLRNIVKEPENVKFRKIRMGNPKIKEAIGDVPGGVELLECLGFEFKEESGEMWLMMEDPSPEQLGLVKNVIFLMGPKKAEELPSTAPTKKEEPVAPKQVDRQIKVFFSVPESVAARIELPDSFYNLSSEELRREAEARRKKIEESKLLIPKSYREKQAKAAKKRYNKTVIRIQFPDGVVLQAIFLPSELTGVLYEFVSSALKDPSLEFELIHPVLIKRRVIPHFPAAGQKGVTFEDEDLVPAALIKFRPIETDDAVFTGLCNELLEISEPLVSSSAVPPS